jgi:hypothetical protein
MNKEINTFFKDDECLFKFEIIKGADHDGVYIVYKNDHKILDGLSMIKIISRMQDGGIEADKAGSIALPNRPDLTWS